jgi:protein-S-isoprenylcysteine O-methyltransferase Ste14
MSTLVIVLRAISLLAFAGPTLLVVSGRHGEPKTRASQEGGGRAPLVANLSAFGLFFTSLLIFSGSSEASMALPLALAGCLLALAGAALVLRSRAELGPAWSFVPKADQGTGLITTGPYRLVRHPIYLGLALLAMGEALAFGSWPALMIAVRNCPDLRLARPRGGETAQPHIWRALRRLPTANQDDHPVPSPNPARDASMITTSPRRIRRR